MDSGVSVKFLMVGETNSMVGYHLMAEGYSIQLGSGGGAVSPPPSHPHQQVQSSALIITIMLILIIITVKSQPQVPYKVVPY